jgi:outer membrane lipoprotein LolB
MRYFWCLLLALVSGCTSFSPSTPMVRPLQAESQSFTLNGRISVRHQDDTSSTSLHWTHKLESDKILLLTPLGQTAARIYWDAQSATLDNGDEHYQAESVEILMQKTLGWHLPLNGLHCWALGVAVQGSPAEIERDENDRIVRLLQDGWKITYSRFFDERRDSLPSRLQLTRGDLKVKLLIDEWDWESY